MLHLFSTVCGASNAHMALALHVKAAALQQESRQSHPTPAQHVFCM
jgi:hypothetical protein